MGHLPEKVMEALSRLLVRIFFRGVEVEGMHNVPTGMPVVMVANHTNGLVDGLLLMATLPRFPRFMGKSTLFRIPPLWPFLKLARVIPIYRLIDGKSGQQNQGAFVTCHRILAAGGVVALFPEGISHDESSVQPLRTGAARIALESQFNEGADGLRIVPIGLTYDAKARFRSRALVRIGHPLSLEAWGEAYREDGVETVRAVTDFIASALEVVSPSYDSWQQAEQLGRIAQILVRAPTALPSDVALADQTDVAERLAALEPGLGRDVLLARYATYARDLDLLGLGDEQVTARYPGTALRRTVMWSVVKVVLALPVAALGAMIHVVPYQLMKQLARRPRNEGIKATVKVVGCFFLFAAVYALIGVYVARAEGVWSGLVAALVAPATGYVALRLGERVKRIGGLLEGYHTVMERHVVLGSVISHRAEVVRAGLAVLEDAVG